MSNIISLTLKRITPSQDGQFICKLQHKTETTTVEEAFGTAEKKSQVTYYRKLKTVKVPLETTLPIDLDNYEVKESPFVPDEIDGVANTEGKEITCKWLWLKK